MKLQHDGLSDGSAIPAARKGEGTHGSPKNPDELVEFVDEPEPGGDSADAATPPWVVLIVDDDRNVHQATLVALARERVKGRGLRFLHAYSASEARQVIAANPDVAVILLDVVMETHDAGLRLVPVIREELGRRDVRIIIRTGQPGYAPEHEVTRDYAINGYLMKAKLTWAVLVEAIARVLENPASPCQATH